MQKINADKQIEGLIQYLSFPDEKGNADLIRNYFRSKYPEFKCETQANNADGYVPGHFILELKSKQKDWFKGLIQGLAYKRILDVTVIVVATNHFLGVWDVKNIPNQILEDIYQSDSSASSLGIQLAKKYRRKPEGQILPFAFHYPKDKICHKRSINYFSRLHHLHESLLCNSRMLQ
ncbi:hypothetical protein OQJ02_00315 [Legionella sp. PATHC032]|uniref:hypothetical protein n=1 Tax=Legionella sp. PATHC032 TaxID=2992039 RepID=UPI001B1EF655|nr:hypothetical protein [Legionella sp. PATHC032]MCW8420080.1 hypothetical protein [Legionella sp. PATHC032]HAZ7574479.1 hypothetical protein [Legionella pneumophila]HBA1635387.1 hypothetical protein [Legionella pneumophila]